MSTFYEMAMRALLSWLFVGGNRLGAAANVRRLAKAVQCLLSYSSSVSILIGFPVLKCAGGSPAVSRK